MRAVEEKIGRGTSCDDFLEHRLEIFRQAIEKATGKTSGKADGAYE